MMMKILYAVTKSNFGGAQRYVFELAARAKAAGHEVHVACGGNGLLKTKLEEAGIPVHTLGASDRDINISKDASTLSQIYKLLGQIRPDIVHLNSPKLGGTGALAARILNLKTNWSSNTEKSQIKILYTNHGWPFKEERPVWQNILIRFFSWLTVMLSHRTIVLSNLEFDMAKGWPGAKDKLHVLRNGVAGFPLKEKDYALISLLGEEKAAECINQNKRIIGSIAELHKNKGIHYALEGFKKYLDAPDHDRDIHFILIGDGELKHAIETDIARLNLGEHVTLAGYIREAREYLHAFDIFLLSSIKEGLPYAILEAGIARVPVIATNVGGISEVIENYNTGFLINPRRPDEIKNTLMYIDDHSGEERQYASRLAERISEQYDFEKQFEKYSELLASLTTPPATPPTPHQGTHS